MSKIPGAPPTAPGGMSEKALAVELRDEHGWSVEQILALNWPAKIDAVILGRAEREAEADAAPCDLHELVNCAECNGVAADHDASLADNSLDPAEMFGEPDTSVLVVDGVGVIEEVEDNFDDLAEFDPEPEPVIPSVQEVATQASDVEAAIADMLDETEFAPADPDALFIGLPGGKDYIFDGHLGASPSSAERWMNCTASLAATRAFLETLTPNQLVEFAQGSSAARQGTTAHAASESELRLALGRIEQAEHDANILSLTLEPEAEAEAYSPEMAEHITEYVDLVKSYGDDYGHENVLIEQHVEAAVELQTVDSEGNYHVHVIRGSVDCGVMPTPEHPDLVAIDLKYGNGIDVDVDANPQVRIYALGLLAQLVERHGSLPKWARNVIYHIVQPRLGGTKTWTESVDDLLDWCENVLSPALTEALGGMKSGAAFRPAPDTCQWCPARGSCAALTKQRIEEGRDLFDKIQETEFETGIIGAFPETESLTGEELGMYYSQIRALTSIAEDLKAEAQRRLHRGEPVLGFHLVNYQPVRQWSEEAEEKLDPRLIDPDLMDPETASEVLYKTVRLSPTQAEASLKAAGMNPDIIKGFIVKPDIKPMVSTGPNDRRKPWAGRPPESMFDALPEED